MSEASFLSEIGLPRILRYGYGGLLLMLLAAVINPKEVAAVVGSLGTVLAPLAALGVGAGIYAIHRYVIGEVGLYPCLHLIHRIWDRLRGRRDSTTDTVRFLATLGVKCGDRRASYTAARRHFFDSAVREQLDIAHGELHILWITVDEALLASVYLRVHGRLWLPLLLIGLFVAGCAAYADIRQHQLERHMLRIEEGENLGKGKISSFLRARGYC